MRIVHVAIHYFPVVGGMENAVRGLAREQAKLGHDVHVLTSNFGLGASPIVEETDGVTVHRIASGRIHYPDLTFPLRTPNIGLEKGDVVHAHGEGIFSLRILKWARGKKATTACHFMALKTLNGHPRPLIRTLGPSYQEFLLRRAVALTDLKLARSYRDLLILKKRPAVQEAFLVPDGIDASWLANQPPTDAPLAQLGLSEARIVLFIGRLHSWKGVDTLIRSIPMVMRSCPTARFVFAGPGVNGPYLDLARSLGVSEHVVFLGFITESLKMAIIDACEVAVIPSKIDYAEVFPMVISEAWSRRKPVVATRVGGIPYRITDGVNGLLVDPMNPELLGEAIVRLLEDRQARNEMGKNGRTQVRSWNDIAELTLQLYQKRVSEQ